MHPQYTSAVTQRAYTRESAAEVRRVNSHLAALLVSRLQLLSAPRCWH